MNLSEIYLSPFHSECFKIHQSSVLVLIASLCFSGFNYFFNGHVSLYILNCFIWGSQNFLGLNFVNIGVLWLVCNKRRVWSLALRHFICLRDECSTLYEFTILQLKSARFAFRSVPIWTSGNGTFYLSSDSYLQINLRTVYQW